MVQCTITHTVKAAEATAHRCDVETATLTKRDEYYKNLVAQAKFDEKPEGWDEALPFEAIPGPKAFP
ncbi:hypothetical protein NQ317_009324 [Molorchus minor]|uniref:Uncharacterized protein n=1 Tax=Molorchus minor TaxID=1323400 RepID=A0ABQ9JHC5_9CUCU|nr:hypothetical protein NQ317_009324 [Molorchus minor]